MTTTSEVLDNVGGALMIGGCLALRPLLRPRRLPLGGYRRRSHAAAARRRAHAQCNRHPDDGSDCPRPAATIWPWMAQIGQERGGLYSYELLENIARCQMHNADHIEPAWELQVGERVRLGPPGYPVYAVVGIERNRWLLLAGADFKTCQPAPIPAPGATEYINDSWVFYLDERGDGTTRLITRARLDYAPHTFGQKLTWEWSTDPIGFVMTRRMLLGIKERAERQ